MSSDNPYVSLHCPRCGAILPSSSDEIVCEYCSARLILRRTLSARQGADVETGPDLVVAGERLDPYLCQDAHTGMAAFRILIPQGWQFLGGIGWTHQRPSAPVGMAFQIVSPDGRRAIDAMPTLHFTWSGPSLMSFLTPSGSMHLGYEVRKPVSAQQAVCDYLLPRFRPLPGLEVLSAEDDPAWVHRLYEERVAHGEAQAGFQSNMQLTQQGLRMRIRYPWGDISLEEEIRTVAEYVRVSMGFGMGETVYWTLGYTLAHRTPAGSLGQMAILCDAVYRSLQWNAQWRATVQQISQMMVQNRIQQMNQVGAAARQIARSQSQIGDMIWEGYQSRQRTEDAMWDRWSQRQNTMDRLADSYSQAIRGVDAYVDPSTGRSVEMPGGYRQAWTNGLGEYILSDDVNYDPNLGTNVSWTEMPRGS
jgi:DNA-directed RNA polymerase subunit RPC12/RpoP